MASRKRLNTPVSEPEVVADGEVLGGPLVFISHDSRDAELAEAFSKLMKSASAGMIKTFRSSDTKGTEGIDFGEEWYKSLMSSLQATSDVVCLFTERSIDRPWILFEAGVAKGRVDTPVVGIALGVPLKRISTGPFHQFQNMVSSPENLTKLINQFGRRVSRLELDADVVKAQVAAFKVAETEILKKLAPAGGKGATEEEENPAAALLEELKAMPSRIADRLSDSDPYRRRRGRRFHPMMMEELMHMSGDPEDPVAILMAASMVRDDAPWLYELAMEAYRATKSGDAVSIKKELKRMENYSEKFFHGGFMEEFGFGDKETSMMTREFPRMLRRMLERTLEARK